MPDSDSDSDDKIYVSGYFISFETARAIMKKLQIPDKDCSDHHLHMPINDWLAKNNKTRPLAGTIIFPESGFKPSKRWHGVLLVTHFLKVVDDNPAHVENSSDQRVKDWIIESAGVKEDDLLWHGCIDRFAITQCGTIPLRNQFAGKETRFRLTRSQLFEYKDSKLDILEYVEQVRARGEHVVQLD